MIERIMDWVTHWVGHWVMIPAMLALIAGMYAFTNVDVANITISIVSLLLLPVLQHSQNRDGAAIQVKLDELIRSSDARDDFIGIDRQDEETIKGLRT